MQWRSLFLIIFLFGGPLFGWSQSGVEGFVARVEADRADKEAELRNRKTSPLQRKDRRNFQGLNYFDVDPNYFVDASYTLLQKRDTLEIMTSSGKVKRFERYGLFVFSLQERSDTLFGYKRIWPEGYTYEGEPYLFIPFNDHTNGNETYGGGRYLDVPIPAEGAQRVALDFNASYNPYCAYGGGFSCPIPPEENRLSLAVKAGEKQYAKH